MSLFIAGFVATIVSFLVARLMLNAPIKDVPVERSSHSVVTPKAGGLAFVSAWLVYLSIIHLTVFPILSSPLLILIGLACLMAAIGLADDVFHLSHKPRFIIQLIVAAVMIKLGYVIDYIPLPGEQEILLGPFSLVVTLLWVVGFINAVNFMDGLNGLCSGGALMASMLLLYFVGASPISFLLYGLIFGLSGFMRYNFIHGRVFMGDVGSQFLGSIFAILTLMAEPLTGGELRFYIIPLLFLPFIFDTALTFVRRLLAGKNLLEPHREFLFHRLNSLGLSHLQVSLLYMGLIAAQAIFVVYFLASPSFIKLGLNLGIYGLLSSWVYAKTSIKKAREIDA